MSSSEKEEVKDENLSSENNTIDPRSFMMHLEAYLKSNENV